jgi:hypothetical protein
MEEKTKVAVVLALKSRRFRAPVWGNRDAFFLWKE